MKYLKSFRFWEIFSKYLLLGLSLYIIALGSSNTDLLNRGIKLISAQEYDTESWDNEPLYGEYENPDWSSDDSYQYETIPMQEPLPLYDTVVYPNEPLFTQPDQSTNLYSDINYFDAYDTQPMANEPLYPSYETVPLNDSLYDTVVYPNEPLYPVENFQANEPLYNYDTVVLPNEPLYDSQPMQAPLYDTVVLPNEPLYDVVPAPAPLPSYPIVAIPQQPAGPPVVFSNTPPVSSNANLGPYVLYRAAVACEGRNTIEETRWSDGRSERRNIGNTGFCPGQDSPIVANAAPIQSSNPQSGRYVLYTALKCNIPSPYAVTEETRWSDGSVTERNLGVTGYCGTPQPNVVSNPGAPIQFTNPPVGNQPAPPANQPTNPILATCNVSGTNPNVNDVVVYSVSASGGNGNLRFRWDNDDQIGGREGQVMQVRYPSVGTRNTSVVVSDSRGESIRAFCPQVSVLQPFTTSPIPGVPNPVPPTPGNPGVPNPGNPVGGIQSSPISAFCSSSATNLSPGQTVTFSLQASGGAGTYRYSWDTKGGSIVGGSAQSPVIQVRYNVEGIYSPTGQVFDNYGNTSNIAFCSSTSVIRPFANVPVDGQIPVSQNPVVSYPVYNNDPTPTQVVTVNNPTTTVAVQNPASQCPANTVYGGMNGSTIICNPTSQTGSTQGTGSGQNQQITTSGGTNTNSTTGQTTDTTKQPVVVQQNTNSNIRELPKTGLPLVAWGITSLVPVGLRLRKWGSKGQTLESNSETANSLWMEREFNRV